MFSDQIWTQLGKGRIHARLLYEEFFRTGKISDRHPSFANAKTLFKEILELVEISLPSLVQEKTDGQTGKILLRTQDQLEIESVLIPMQSGGTLCISSQVGCRMGCVFCETGRMGLLRNLTVEEIVAQVFMARHILGFKVRNIVFMGMGEPFDNYDAVMQSVKVLMDPKGMGFGRNHITLSTSGCIEGIERLIQEGAAGPNLAVSINAPQDSIRNRLMPINRKHNMQQLYQSMHKYCSETGRQILAAYVLLKDQNDSMEQADQLADFLKGLNVKINLIPYNPQSCDRFQPSDLTTLNAFALRLRSHGYYTLLRVTKGQKIMAACGQLGNLKLRKKLRDQRAKPLEISNPSDKLDVGV
jgi:23S rRNA (adenine2503-C2)-methyltransferase